MVKYNCERCKREFSQKGHYEAHQRRKVPCKASKKDLGQYFTIAPTLQKFIFDSVQYRGSLLLEPSFGAGHLLQLFKESDPNYPMVCYELDHSIQPVVSFNKHQVCIYGDFMAQPMNRHFKTIVGNPPYVKQSSGNLYLAFIAKCLDWLDESGELLFIVPSEFLKQTSANAIVTRMATEGSFTHFYFPHDESLFENASVDVVAFRYQKDLHTPTAIVNGVERTYAVTNGILTFTESGDALPRLGSLFDIYVGMVTGRDEIYKVPFGTIDMRTDKDRVERYLFPTSFPTDSQEINEYLLQHKPALLARKIRSFTETNWFEWGAPRNLKKIQTHWGKPCLYVRMLTRDTAVAFTGTVEYFGGTLLCLIPKASADLKKICDALNQESFRTEYTYSGRFKIGHKQLANAAIRF